MLSQIRNILIIGFTRRLGGGGGNIHFDKLIPYWESSGIKVTVFDPVKVDKFTLTSVLKSTLQSIFIKIDSLAYLNNCDIILSESPYPPDVILGFRISRKYNKPLSIYVHHITPGLPIHPFRRGILRVLLNVGYILLILSFVKIFRIPIFLDNPNTLKQSSIPVYPDLDAITNKELNYSPIENRLDSCYDICYIGRIEHHKGVEDIIKVVRILKDHYGISLRVALAGKGNNGYVNKITKMIRKSGLSEYISMKGYLTEDQKFELLKRSRVFLFLSYEEGWSISVMESAIAGTPIVAYALSAYYYLRDNYFPVEIGNLEQCAESVKEALYNKELSAMKAIKAKECSDKFSYEFIAKQQLIFFKKISRDYEETARG